MIISHGIENEGEENEDDYAEFSFADISSDYRIQQNVQYQNHWDSPA
jgi:hypothetical protein